MNATEKGVVLHITSAELSPRIPSLGYFAEPSSTEQGYHTTFTLIIEPLILGVLPQTAIPAVFWIILFALGSAMTVPYIRRSMEYLVNTVNPADRSRIKSL